MKRACDHLKPGRDRIKYVNTVRRQKSLLSKSEGFSRDDADETQISIP
jgi:hypothetical protein